MALVHFDELKDAEAKREIEALTAGYRRRADYFVDTLARGLSRIAAFRHPKPVIVRMSDFKTNEYADLLGGAAVRARGGEPDDRVPRRIALLRRALPRRLRARMPGDPAAARRDRAPTTSSS